MRVSIRTLGCKINQFDAGALKEAFTTRGARMVPEGEAADVYIIQTCTVTAKADYQCRQAIRRALNEKPEGARVVVTGCYAQTNPGDIKKIPGVDMVVGNDERDTLPRLVLGGNAGADASGLPVGISAGRSRAFLKVQEGCDCGCSYCIVPAARGTSRSAAHAEVMAGSRSLIARGYHELVLTGVHLGGYGLDLEPKKDLAGLVHDVIMLEGLGRLRLSSVEPMEFTDRMFSLISEHAVEGGKLCRHFHVPLQSADDTVLASMGRRYTWTEYLDVVSRLYNAAPGSCIGADVIVGYPAEDDASFERTYRRIADSPINYLHAFSYSPRPGTRAHAMGDPVHGDVKRERNARLRELAAGKGMKFRSDFKGMEMVVVAEGDCGSMTGLTDNYIRVGFEGRGAASGSPVRVKILRATPDGCAGEVV